MKTCVIKGPLFTLGNPGGRFDIGDAVYTEGIHTNGGQQGINEYITITVNYNLSAVLGFNGHIAHATFYPNFGTVQTGCAPDIGSSGCSHSRAHSVINSNLIRNKYS